jgi:hypothetical protein
LHEQFATETDPGAEAYEPAGHETHALEPVSFAYAPAGHSTHTADEVAPATPEYAPAGHPAHAAEEFAPVRFEYVPAGQDTHALAPAAALYCPGAHATHTPPFGPVYPASQAQLLRDPLKLGAPAFAGHTLQPALPAGAHCPNKQPAHVSLPVAPTPTEYSPAEQLVHAPAPVTALYCPAPHAEQVNPFGPVYPASQAQLLRKPLDAGAREFSGHKLQFGLPSGDH